MHRGYINEQAVFLAASLLFTTLAVALIIWRNRYPDSIKPGHVPISLTVLMSSILLITWSLDPVGRWKLLSPQVLLFLRDSIALLLLLGCLLWFRVLIQALQSSYSLDIVKVTWTHQALAWIPFLLIVVTTIGADAFAIRLDLLWVTAPKHLCLALAAATVAVFTAIQLRRCQVLSAQLSENLEKGLLRKRKNRHRRLLAIVFGSLSISASQTYICVQLFRDRDKGLWESMQNESEEYTPTWYALLYFLTEGLLISCLWLPICRKPQKESTTAS